MKRWAAFRFTFPQCGGFGFTLAEENGACIVSSLDRATDPKNPSSDTRGYAEKIGVRVNDVLVQVNDTTVQGLKLDAVISRVQNGHYPMRLTLWRAVDASAPSQQTAQLPVAQPSAPPQQQHPRQQQIDRIATVQHAHRQQQAQRHYPAVAERTSTAMHGNPIQGNPVLASSSSSSVTGGGHHNQQQHSTPLPHAGHSSSHAEMWMAAIKATKRMALGDGPHLDPRHLTSQRATDDASFDIGARFVEAILSNKARGYEWNTPSPPVAESTGGEGGAGADQGGAEASKPSYVEMIKIMRAEMERVMVVFDATDAKKLDLKRRYDQLLTHHNEYTRAIGAQRQLLDGMVQKLQDRANKCNAIKFALSHQIAELRERTGSQLELADDAARKLVELQTQHDGLNKRMETCRRERARYELILGRLREHDQEIQNRKKRRVSLMNEVCNNYDRTLSTTHAKMVELSNMMKRLRADMDQSKAAA